MANYLLIETKSPLEGGRYAFDLGKQLRQLQHDVTVYLLQDGVFAARKNFRAGQELIQAAATGGFRVVADAVSLRQRGIVGDRVAKDVSVGEIGQLVDLVMERSDKAIWH